MALMPATPLTWPVGRPRTRERKRARFGTRTQSDGGYRQSREMTIAGGMNRLRDELDLLGAEDTVVTTNLPVRKDGLPLSSAREPSDPGVSVYFRLEGNAHCLACDRWDRVADNLAAVAAHIFAIRGQSRWGVGDLAQAFAGYRALPAMDAIKPWWERLGCKEPPATAAEAKAKWLTLAAKYHPDKGGCQDQAADINSAWRDAERYYERT